MDTPGNLFNNMKQLEVAVSLLHLFHDYTKDRRSMGCIAGDAGDGRTKRLKISQHGIDRISRVRAALSGDERGPVFNPVGIREECNGEMFLIATRDGLIEDLPNEVKPGMRADSSDDTDEIPGFHALSGNQLLLLNENLHAFFSK